MITNMWMEDANGYGKLKILRNPPMGQLVKTMLESGVKLGVPSQRGGGSTVKSQSPAMYRALKLLR